MLNASDVISLYKLKFNASVLASSHINKTAKGRSGPVSKMFGITARAVRDIWIAKHGLL